MPGRDLLLLLGTALLSAGLTLWVKRWAVARGYSLGRPRERDIHTSPIPRLGGLAVAASFLVVSLIVALFLPTSLAFVPERFLGLDRNLAGIALGVIVLLAVGIYDDIRGLSPLTKLGFHILAGVILASSGILIQHLTNPLGGQIVLGSLAFVFVVGWVVFMINAINWLDGLDGLASGISLIATTILYLLAIRPDVGQVSMSVLAIILAGALIGFLPFNFYRAKIFLGDSGSQVLGFLLATFAIISGGKLATAFLILGVPLLDTIWVIVRRVATNQPVYKADRLHFHHRLLQAGLGQRQAVLTLYAVSTIFGIIALNTRSLGKLIAGLLLLAMMVVAGLFLLWLKKTEKSK